MKILRLSLKIFKFVFIGLLAIALLFNLINIFKRVVLKEQIPLVMGYGSAVIITGSMEPVIMPGDLVIVHEQGDYEIDDIVTYQGSNHPITHRIVEKTLGGYVTQGEANNADDGEIEQCRIIGKVVKIIPRTGNVILFFQSPPGILILILSMFAMIEAPRLVEKVRKIFQANKGGKYFRR